MGTNFKKQKEINAAKKFDKKKLEYRSVKCDAVSRYIIVDGAGFSSFTFICWLVPALILSVLVDWSSSSSSSNGASKSRLCAHGQL